MLVRGFGGEGLAAEAQSVADKLLNPYHSCWHLGEKQENQVLKIKNYVYRKSEHWKNT